MCFKATTFKLQSYARYGKLLTAQHQANIARHSETTYADHANSACFVAGGSKYTVRQQHHIAESFCASPTKGHITPRSQALVHAETGLRHLEDRSAVGLTKLVEHKRTQTVHLCSLQRVSVRVWQSLLGATRTSEPWRGFILLAKFCFVSRIAHVIMWLRE